jgi:hypothetical protein
MYGKSGIFRVSDKRKMLRMSWKLRKRNNRIAVQTTVVQCDGIQLVNIVIGWKIILKLILR